MNVFLRHEVEFSGEETVTFYERSIPLPSPPTPGLEIKGKDFSFYVVDVSFYMNVHAYVAIDYTTFDSLSSHDHDDFILKITQEGFKKVRTEEVKE